MAIAHRSSTPAIGTTQTTTTSTTAVIPADVVDGDIVVATVVNGDAATAPSSVTDDSGIGSWAMHANAAGVAVGISLWWKRITTQATERGKTVTAAGLTNSSCMGLSTYVGCVATGDPFDVAGTTEQNAATNLDNAGVTTVTSGAMIGLVAGFTDDAPAVAANSVTATSPTTLTDRLRHISSGGTDSQLVHASAPQSAAGATGLIAWTGTSDGGASIGFALKPAPPPASATYTQRAGRFRKDDGDQATATWRAVAGADISMVADRNVRLRFDIASATNPPTQNKILYLGVSKNAGAYAPVTASSTNVRASASANVADGAATTEQMAGAGTFSAGTFDEVDGAAIGFTATPATGQDTEVEYCFQVRSADVAAGDTLDFRIFEDAALTDLLDTYTDTPRITVAANPNGEARIPLTDLTGTLATGASTGTVNILLKKEVNGALTPAANPTATIEIRDGVAGGATILKTLATNAAISDTTADGALLSYPFDQTGISAAQADNAAVWITTTNVVGASIRILPLEWNATLLSATNFNRPVNDTLAVADAAERLATYARTATDSADALDTAARLVAYIRTATDTVTVDDAASGTKGAAREPADSVALADQADRLAAYLRTSADAAVVADAADRVAAYIRALNDSTTVADIASRQVTYVRSVADSVTTADTPSSTLEAVISRPITDSATVADEAVRVATYNRPVTDSAVVADVAARIVAYVDTLTDAIPVADDQNVQVSIGARLITDSISVLDNTVRIATFVRKIGSVSVYEVGATEVFSIGSTSISSMFEGVNLADLASSTGIISHSRTPSDALILLDAAERIATFARTTSDAAIVADAAERLAAYIRVSNDPATVADLATGQITAGGTNISRPISDAAGVDDSATTLAAFNRMTADVLILLDSVQSIAAFKRDVQDLVDLTETAAPSRGVAKAVLDAIALADLATSELAQVTSRPVSDTVAVADSRTVRMAWHKVPLETLIVDDAVSRIATFKRTLADAVILGDAASPAGIALYLPLAPNVSVLLVVTPEGVLSILSQPVAAVGLIPIPDATVELVGQPQGDAQLLRAPEALVTLS